MNEWNDKKEREQQIEIQDIIVKQKLRSTLHNTASILIYTYSYTNKQKKAPHTHCISFPVKYANHF